MASKAKKQDIQQATAAGPDNSAGVPADGRCTILELITMLCPGCNLDKIKEDRDEAWALAYFIANEFDAQIPHYMQEDWKELEMLPYNTKLVEATEEYLRAVPMKQVDAYVDKFIDQIIEEQDLASAWKLAMVLGVMEKKDWTIPRIERTLSSSPWKLMIAIGRAFPSQITSMVLLEKAAVELQKAYDELMEKDDVDIEALEQEVESLTTKYFDLESEYEDRGIMGNYFAALSACLLETKTDPDIEGTIPEDEEDPRYDAKFEKYADEWWDWDGWELSDYICAFSLDGAVLPILLNNAINPDNVLSLFYPFLNTVFNVVPEEHPAPDDDGWDWGLISEMVDNYLDEHWP